MKHKPFRERRRRNPRPQKECLLIVCEGTTEWNYFEAVRRSERVRFRFAVTLVEAGGGSREKIADQAIKANENSPGRFDRACVVMDVEESSHRNRLKVACDKLASAGIEVYLSHLSFEVWFLSHLEPCSKPFVDVNSVAKHLDKRWKKRFEEAYDHTAMNHFDRLQTDLGEAMKNARTARTRDHMNKPMCDANSSTEVYLLMANLGFGETSTKTDERPVWKSPSKR